MVRLATELIEDKQLEKMSEKLKAIAHPVRLQIVNVLMDGERSVGDLIRTLGQQQSMMSQQLTLLKVRGVLKSRRNGNLVFYSLQDNGMKNIIAAILAEL